VDPSVCFVSKKRKTLSTVFFASLYSIFLSVYSKEVYTAFIWLDITLAVNIMHCEAARFKEEAVTPVEETIKAPEK
jgi:hypothetical protein